MATIHPVTRRFPTSQDVWEDTNLPLSVVLTPLHEEETTSKVHHSPPPASLHSIPKCRHCGAPHASSQTHFRPSPSIGGDSSVLLCYLCGHTSWINTSNNNTPQRPTEKTAPATLFELPLRLGSLSSSSSITPSTVNTTTTHSTYLPALACPPLWLILLDASVPSRIYWQNVSELLLGMQNNIPHFVHVGLLACNADSMAIWDLHSPIPHVKHYRILDNKDDNDIDHLDAVGLALQQSIATPTHWGTHVRALVDYSMTTTQPPSSGGGGMNLAGAIEFLTEWLHRGGQTPGQRHDDGNSQQQQQPQQPPPGIPYAGAKLTCFIGQRPCDISDAYRNHKSTITNTTGMGHGGRGGRTVQSSRFVVQTSSSTVRPTTDLTARGLQDHYYYDGDYEPLNRRNNNNSHMVVEEFEELGRACAQVAMGVDLLGLLGGDENYDIPDLGLALFGMVAHKSGAPGPLLFDITHEEHRTALQREVAARVPWNSSLVFGAELRVRLPMGFVVDETPNESSKDKGPQLAPFYTDRGLQGPASSVEDSTHLWRMGCCDPHTAWTIDLAIKQRNVRKEIMVEGLGEVAIKPVIQTCFAYTKIVPDSNGEYRTVRQMRIHSCPVPFASDTETLLASMDPEALAVVLFHKLAVASLQDGLDETVAIAEDWLQATLSCINQSAVRYQALHDERPPSISNENGTVGFVANERLLDREGDLTADDVLLAQGHARAKTIPLMIYLLLQCDAFRNHSGPQQSLDLRYAALSQMLSMTPSTLTRCIAPRIQLWASAKDEREPILDVIDLRSEAVRLAIAEYGDSNDLILFVDAPDQLLVLDCQFFGKTKVPPKGSSLPLVFGSALKQAITDTAQSYRSPPTIATELTYNESSIERVVSLLADVLIEDAPTAHQSNYDEWKAYMARRVRR